jgi:hypothetical protein
VAPDPAGRPSPVPGLATDLPGSAATGEVAVDRTDRDLVGAQRAAGAAIAAGAAGGLQDARADALEGVQVAGRDAVVAHRRGPELEVERDAGGDPQAPVGGPPQHGVVVVEVVALAGRARAAVGDVDAHRPGHVGEPQAVARIPGRRHHRRHPRAVDVDRPGVDGIGIAVHPWRHGEVDAAALAQEAHRLRIGRDDAGETTELGGHVGQRGALVDAHARDDLARELEDLAHAAALAHEGQGQQVQDDVLGRDAQGERAVEFDPRRLRNGQPDGTGDEGVGHVGRADAEGHAAERAAVRGVRIGAHDQLAGQGIVLRHHGMRDACDVGTVVERRLVLRQRAVGAQAMGGGEVALGFDHPMHVGHQAAAHVGRAFGRSHRGCHGVTPRRMPRQTVRCTSR